MSAAKKCEAKCERNEQGDRLHPPTAPEAKKPAAKKSAAKKSAKR